ncbi:aminotransferase class I/II-fold pyridoxal phosphate-dependent enzyme [Chrysiogenes arsenatis]|uniref:aminotransferase class I/II-fold pyridoxal phosphate-dependent enzyme n=1 Tax=Chrysiogenes arsenatis TaxID=309797 RepID=UPI00040C92C9|nr:8-amino-7-oxononanoate synthase [Chrysiogenes arsenatis]
MQHILAQRLETLRNAGLFRQLRTIRHYTGSHAEVDGEPLVLFSSNDYLGYATHPTLLAAARAASCSATSATASPLVNGFWEEHHLLVRELCNWKGVEDAMLFPAGYQGNVALMSALLHSPHDQVFSDALNHASIIDGCRLGRGTVHVYRHNDIEHLESLLVAHVGNGLRTIVTDAVYSMDGDVAPLVALLELAKRHNALLVVDEAHSTGVLGARGQGVTEIFGSHPDHLLTFGTFGKALGSMGAYATGTQLQIDYLRNMARGYIFSTAFPPGIAHVNRTAVQMLAKGEQVDALKHNIRALAEGLTRAGWDFSQQKTAIFPIVVGEAETAVDLSLGLRQAGFFVPAIRYPTVARGTARLRIALNANHTPEAIERLIVSLIREYNNTGLPKKGDV